MTIQEPLEECRLLHQQIRVRSGDSLALDALTIPALIYPVQTPGADGGLNANALHSHESGLLVQVLQYTNMRAFDWVDVFWGDDAVSVASALVTEEHAGSNFPMFIAADKVPEGLHELFYVVTRAGSGNKERSLSLNVLVRRDLPGGIDPEPDLDGHQRLVPAEPELPASGIIDEEAARNGIKVTITAYPNMREYDRITLSWGGVRLEREVQPGEGGQAVEITVPEAVILEAGDSDEMVLVYRVVDEVHNVSSDWSMRAYVVVEVDGSRPDAPLIINPDDNAIPYDVIDLDKLGDNNLFIEVLAPRSGDLAVGDSVTLKWVGTTAQGQDITYEWPPKIVSRVPSTLDFEVPNANVRGLGHGRGVASYTLSRVDGTEVTSKRAFAGFIGEEQKLLKPAVTEAVGGSLDPDLGQATVVVPGAVLELNDWVVLTWLGIQASGSPLLYSDQRQVTSTTVGQPMTFPVPASHIKPLDGGRVEVYYELHRAGVDPALTSEREHLQVGEAQNALPAPGVSPAASDGWLDPDTLPGGVDVVIAPYTNMRAGQTVYMEWQATVGGHVVDHVEIVPFSVNKPVRFPIKPEQLQQNVEGEVGVWYRVEESGQPTRRSESLHLKIGKEKEEEAPLIAPVVLEAVDGLLDPLNGATVRVTYTDMSLDDIVAISWIGASEEGSYQSPQHPGSVTGFVDIPVPLDVLRASDGHGVQVYYARVRNGQPALSPPLNLVVMEIPPEGLPTPVIPQVKDGLLDLQDFNGDAQITVEPWLGIVVGQRYWLRVHGIEKGGSPHIIEMALAQPVTAAEVTKGLEFFLPRSDLLLLRNYSELRVELKVALNGGDNESVASRFPLLIVLARVEHEVIFEDFKGYADQVAKYGEVMHIPTMAVTNQTTESLASISSVSGVAGRRALRFDLKFKCRFLDFTSLRHTHWMPVYIFYDAQGREVGRASTPPGPDGYINIEFRAQNGVLISRMDAESRIGQGHILITRFIFEL